MKRISVLKYLIFFCLFFCWINRSFSQKNLADSLEKVLKAHQKNDTTKIDLLNKIAFAYSGSNPEKGILFADQAINLTKQIDTITRRLGTAYNYKALNYTYLSNDSLAIYWYEKSIAHSKKIKDKLGEATALNNLSIIYSERSEYRKSLGLRLRTLEILTEFKVTKKIPAIINNIGNIYFYLSDYPNALDYYFKALKGAQELKGPPTETEVSALMNIGNIYEKLGEKKKALYYNNLVAKLNNTNGDLVTYSMNLGNIARLHGDLKQYGKSLAYLNEALAVSRKIKYTRGEATHLNNIASLYYELKQYGSALSYTKKTISVCEKNQNLAILSIAYNLYAKILINAPDKDLQKINFNLNNRYVEAERYAKLSFQSAQSGQSRENEKNALEILSIIHQKQGNFQVALEEYKKHVLFEDSIRNNDKKVEIAKKEIQFEADKKQVLANKEIQNQKTIRNYGIFGICILLVVAIIIFIFYKKHRDSIQKQNELLYKAKVADTDMRILRLQMNPHFIFNSLNSISDYISKNDIQNADYYLSKFAKLMRGILENSEEKEIPLADELKMLELYMQLEGSRLNNTFTYEIKISEDVDPEITMVPPLILQPFVENSIWHGLTDKDSGGKITIEVTRDNTLLNCVVEDNGIGRKGAKPNLGKSYGMKITKDRIDLLNKLKNTNASVNLIDLEKGTRVEVKLPFETEA